MLTLTLAQPAPNVQHEIDTVLFEMNRLRQEKGVNPLCSSDKLARSAHIQSKYQSDVAQMTHDNPLGIAGRMLAVGFAVNQGRAGENVGKDSQLSGSQMVHFWQHSPSHYGNIVDPKYNFVGVSVVQSTASTHDWYWTVHFAQGTEDEVCRDSTLNPHNYAPEAGDDALTRSIVANLNGRIKLLLASDDNSNNNKKTAPPSQAPQTMATLSNRAAEFTPPTVTETQLRTVSFVSTQFVPTTIISLVTMTTTCPTATCPRPPPCICPLGSTTPGASIPGTSTLASSTSTTTTNAVDERATVLILTNSVLTTTTIVPPRQSKLSIPSPPKSANQVSTVYHCPSITTVYRCTTKK